MRGEKSNHICSSTVRSLKRFGPVRKIPQLEVALDKIFWSSLRHVPGRKEAEWERILEVLWAI